ncbi:uncharacterized protein LOC116616611 [Nematostella vectensis]|uniref:uncharacterized protein LOC116616611 n=1 Tax=Nematostella vectensis TaxID=45351 RepID=UPI00139054C4|nr:uncharacterized protein LOC116616611 [Nematostella vectensis]XP_048576247.1 uncharacterized protein LOC116616611 [Nematostella vectensis]XP_048576248.1 uncharacterized protein LOC116616611 [Nematostella vectensis]
MDKNNNDGILKRIDFTATDAERRVSKGQAKMFMTRNAGEKQNLKKLTRHLDKEKAAKASQISYAQKLFFKKYGNRAVEYEKGGTPSRKISRDRSSSWDPMFIREDPDKQIYRSDPGGAHGLGTDRGRSRSGSHDHDHRSRKIPDSRRNPVAEDHLRVFVTRPSCTPASVPRVFSLGDLASQCEGDECGRKFSSAENISRLRSGSFFSSEGTSQSSSVEELGTGNNEGNGDIGTRPRSLSDILPPITLPPIYQQEARRLKPKSSKSRTGGGIPMPDISRNPGITRRVLGKQPLPSEHKSSDGLDSTLSDCRYLRQWPIG